MESNENVATPDVDHGSTKRTYVQMEIEGSLTLAELSELLGEVAPLVTSYNVRGYDW